VREIRFESAYMYFFSPLEGTIASRLPGQLPEEIRKERLARLIEIQNSIAMAESRKLLNAELEILVEGISKKGKNHLIGKTQTGRLVDFKGNEDLIGKYVTLRICRTSTWTLSGELLSK